MAPKPNKRKHADMIDLTTTSKALQHEQTQEVLDVFETLRANGIEDLVSLPRLVVAGDTSSGKSSVLQRLTGIPFPSGEGVVTKFATEVAMRPASEQSFSVYIDPDKTRPASERKKLKEFRHDMKTVADFYKVHKSAAALLEAPQSNRRLLRDVLRIELRGPELQPLTVVDLPGLIQATSTNVSTHDKELSHKTVEEYVKNPRAIILAIVSADNSVFNQAIMDKAGHEDPNRERTIGVITKPDAVTAETDKEKEWITLARNLEIPLKRGWHVLMNKAEDIVNPSPEDIAEAEQIYFAHKRFSVLEKKTLGLDNLRERVVTAVYENLIAALPELDDEFQKTHDKAKARLVQLGDSRKDMPSQRRYMIQTCSIFNSLAASAIAGNYSDKFFDDIGEKQPTTSFRKLRASVEGLKIDYARAMRLFAASRRIDGAIEIDTNAPTAADGEGQRFYTEWKKRGEQNNREQAQAWVLKELGKSRGTELPGVVNPVLITQLFKQLSKNWEDLTKEHVSNVVSLCQVFVGDLLSEVTGPEAIDVAKRVHRLRIDTVMADAWTGAKDRLAELADIQRRDPMTYNPVFEVLVRRADTQRTLKQVESIVGRQNEAFHGYKAEERRQGIDLQALASSMEVANCRRPDMDKSAAERALDLVIACYYTVLTNFIDSVANEVIENQIVQQVPNMLSMAWVNSLDDGGLKQLAAEPSKVTTERELNESTVKKMKLALGKLRTELAGVY